MTDHLFLSSNKLEIIMLSGTSFPNNSNWVK